MEALKVLFLAVLQGITEFLPVSSSGHLAILGKLIGLDEPGVRIEIMLHFGTLISVLFFYRKIIADLIRGICRNDGGKIKLAAAVIVSCIPAVLIYLFFNDAVNNAYDGSISFTGAMLMVTGMVLISLKFIPPKKDDENQDESVKIWQALLIGIAQAIALLPGISRSGSTISCARYLGINGKKAAEFSFLMVLPVLLGGTALQLIEDLSGDAGPSSVGAGLMIVAVSVSAITGYFALRLLIRILGGNKFWMFGIYCFLAGLLTVCL